MANENIDWRPLALWTPSRHAIKCVLHQTAQNSVNITETSEKLAHSSQSEELPISFGTVGGSVNANAERLVRDQKRTSTRSRLPKLEYSSSIPRTMKEQFKLEIKVDSSRIAIPNCSLRGFWPSTTQPGISPAFFPEIIR